QLSWREGQEGRKTNKKPVKNAWQQRRNHVTLHQALADAQRRNEEVGASIHGVGYVFTPESPVWCLDLDNACNDSPRVRRARDAGPTWCEDSLSGHGKHFWFRGQPGTGKQKFPWRDGEAETFFTSGFVAITGNSADDPGVLADGIELASELDLVRKKAKKRHTAPADSNRNAKPSGVSLRASDGKLTDDQLRAKALTAENGLKFHRLWHGDSSDYGDDMSRGDAAFIMMTAFWSNRNAEQMDRLFRASKRMR